MPSDITLQVGVKILLKNSEGKYLLARRSLTKYPDVAGRWDIVGGRINPGSMLLENLRREVKEETGLEMHGAPKLIAAQDILRSEGKHVVRLSYLGHADGDVVLDKNENDMFKWYTFAELLRLDDIDVYLQELLDSGAFAIEEMVDVVDENNAVLYPVTKTVAHREGLLHRTVIAEYINSKGEWALVKQASDRQDAGQYVSPMGGHVSTGETEEDALKREMEEELGLKEHEYTHKLVGKIIYRRTVRGRDENHYFILYETYGDKEPEINHESVSYAWFSEDDIRRILKDNPEQFGAAFIFVLEKFYSRLCV